MQNDGGGEDQFSTEQRVWLLERDFRVLHSDVKDLKSVLNRILWALITLIVTILGSVLTFLIVGAGGG